MRDDWTAAFVGAVLFPNPMGKLVHVLIRCPHCQNGHVAFGRYCAECGGQGKLVVLRSWAEARGYAILEVVR
jgi:hypothetical protein